MAVNPSDVPKEKLLSMYRTMTTIRGFEEKMAELFFTGQIPGFVHSSVGQEAVPTGVCAALEQTDYITSTHRGHGHLLAKGGQLKPMMAEVFGKRSGYCKGKGGSMHIVSYEIGILGANGIVGAGIPIATGAALASRMKGDKRVAVSFFGDGASNEGTFHESLNLAAVWKLPVIFICENNSYGEFTPASESTAVADIAVRAQSYAIPGVTVDGNDVLAVYAAARDLVGRARLGEGPALLEAKTYRWEGHVVGEQAFMPEYRDAKEVEQARAKCPIVRFGETIVRAGLADEVELERIRNEVKSDIEAAVRHAQDAPLPSTEEALADVFAP
jgi:acetoin:2,6-dichlorophenolindophenol oxidoreductase subunit alpha